MDSILKVTERICTTSVRDIQTSGALIDEQTAKQRLDDYFTATGYDRKDPKLIFGQTFSLDSFKKFLNAIEAYNQTGIKEQVVGVRIYNAVSERLRLPGADQGKKLLDVMLVPILSTGDDMYKSINPKKANITFIELLEGEDIILSDGRPCPNECGNGMI